MMLLRRWSWHGLNKFVSRSRGCGRYEWELTKTGLLSVRRHGDFWLVDWWKVVLED